MSGGLVSHEHQCLGGQELWASGRLTSMESIRQYVLAMKDFQDAPDAVQFCERFLKVAQEFKTVKWGLSRELAGIYDCEGHLCFENCQRIVNRIPDLRYFEGYVSLGDFVAEHAWLVDETGEVTDPTLVLHEKLKERVGGYMGLEISMDYINGLFLKEPRCYTRIEQAFADDQW